jgi:hypothetical protein
MGPALTRNGQKIQKDVFWWEGTGGFIENKGLSVFRGSKRSGF